MYRRQRFLALLIVFLLIFATLPAQPVRAGIVLIRMFVGTAGGLDRRVQQSYDRIAQRFNTVHPDIWLVFDYQWADGDSNRAQQGLLDQNNSAMPPDLIGHLDTRAANALPYDLFEDLSPYLDADQVIMSIHERYALEAFQRSGKQLAIPWGLYPSTLVINVDAFNAAKLPLPPKAIGEPYINARGETLPWDWTTLTTLAVQLTTDRAGKHPTERGFKPSRISLYGYADFNRTMQQTLIAWGDMNAGIGEAQAMVNSSVAHQAIQWYQQAIFASHFIPPIGVENNALRAEYAGVFKDKHIAMRYMSIAETSSLTPSGFTWNVAAPPAVPGTQGKQIGVSVNVDGIAMNTQSKNRETAWKVLKWLTSEEGAGLLCQYASRCLPSARTARSAWRADRGQSASGLSNTNAQLWLDTLDPTKVSVVVPGTYMPNYKQVTDTLNRFWTSVRSRRIRNIPQALAQLNTNVQTLLNIGAKKKSE